MLGSSWASLLSLAFIGFAESEQIQMERVSCCPGTFFVSKGAWSHYIAKNWGTVGVGGGRGGIQEKNIATLGP